ELLGIAQLVGGDDLVELHRVGVILVAQRLGAERARRQPRGVGAARLRPVGRAHLPLGLRPAGQRAGSVPRLGRVLGLLALCARVLALAGISLIVAGLVGLAVGVLLVLRFLIVVVLQVGRFIAELEVADQLACRTGEGLLVGERFAQLLEIAAGG